MPAEVEVRVVKAVLAVVVCGAVACGSAPPSSPAVSSTTTSAQSSQSPSLLGLKRGDLFPVESPYVEGRFTTAVDARQRSSLTIKIVAVGSSPGFEPSIITGSPGQRIQLTVYQSKDRSAHYQHNFSIDPLHIDEDIPQGAGHSISVTITLPQSGFLTFYCTYHATAEQQAGEFVIG